MKDSKSNATGAGVPPAVLGSRKLADGRILIPPPPDAARRKGTQRLRCSLGRCSRRGSLKAAFRWWYQDAPLADRMQVWCLHCRNPTAIVAAWIQFSAVIGFHPQPGCIPLLLLAPVATATLAGETQNIPKPPSSPLDPATDTAAKPPWGRIVVVGASASAGFTASEPLGGPNTPHYRLSRYLDAALLVSHMPVENLANSMFFIEAESAGRMQIDQALQLRPTLVIGLDFLFWFCYGEGSTDHERLQRFERGLNLLENIKCPLVLGDIPDASSAANGMLGPEEIPSARAMTAANQRLKEWASKRPQVALLPLSAFMRTVMADQALTIHGRKLPAGQTRLLLQDDVLHPSPHGCAVLALAILDAFQSTHPVPTSGEVCWDLEEVFRLGFHPRRELSGDTPLPMTPAAPTRKSGAR